ncbi:MAG: efflux RND transporter periplasmic adaptor subunit [Rickettsiales bacterium]|nr:efflux RND transporter periplasmic adaptor subunit [Rickettsiales bacterium]
MNRFAKLIVFVAIAGGLYYAYGHFIGQGDPSAAGGAPPVGVAEVIERDVRQWKEFSGRLVAVDQVDIRPRISGTIESIHFTSGSLVKKGALLFVIDPKPFEAAQLSAKARHDLAKADFDRAQSLLESKAISQREFDQRKNDYDVAKADFTKAQLDLGYTKVMSPIEGRVGRAEITVGNLVEAGAAVLTSVVSSSPIYADFEIDEAAYIDYAKEGATTTSDPKEVPVELWLANDVKRDGHVESFDNRLNTGSGTVRVRAIFDNEDGALVPGLFARIKMGSVASRSAILVTDRAIGTDQSKKFVIVVGDDGKTERRELKLGDTADGLRIVEEGLKPGERIVVSGLQRVMMPGQPVTPEPMHMDGTPLDKPADVLSNTPKEEVEPKAEVTQ